MPRPTDVGNFAEGLYSQFPQSIQDIDSKNNYHLLIFCGGIGQAFQQQDTLAHIDGIHPQWSILLDIDRIPDEGVPWLGQFVGVTVDLSLPISDQRQQIRDHVGWQRGTVDTLKKAVGRFLTGTKTVDVIERDSSPYHFTVNTYSTETPAEITLQNLYDDYLTFEAFYEAYDSFESYWLTDPRAYILEVILAYSKPAGLQFDFTVTAGSPGSVKTLQAVWIDYDTFQELLEANETFQNVYLYP